MPRTTTNRERVETECPRTHDKQHVFETLDDGSKICFECNHRVPAPKGKPLWQVFAEEEARRS